MWLPEDLFLRMFPWSYGEFKFFVSGDVEVECGKVDLYFAIFFRDRTVFVPKMVECRHQGIGFFSQVRKYPDAMLVINDNVQYTLTDDFS